MSTLDLSGLWECQAGSLRAQVTLPGTLDQSGIGPEDDPAKQWKAEEVRRIGFWQPGDPIVTRLTRKHAFEGLAQLRRRVAWTPPAGERVFVDVERSRQLRLLVNGREAPLFYPGTLSTPYVFEATGLVCGQDEFCFLCDNRYTAWPREAILYSSAASDETQTNWSGLLGAIRLRTEAPVFISNLRVYPQDEWLRIVVELDAACPWQGEVRLKCEALAEERFLPLRVSSGRQQTVVCCKLKPNVRRWDVGEGNLYTLTASAPGLRERTVRFGIRDFGAQDGHFTLNRRRIFLRGEANCAVFPQTGYCPMDVDTWKRVLLSYRAYGVNCLRFHSHCPPEAAFTAADELGMLMQPELSHWDPSHAFASAEARSYYQTELLAILRCLANHPSFVMLTLGNELQADKAGHAWMDTLLQTARQYDPTRLYANGSNVHYGALGVDKQSDFYTAMGYCGREMRATCDGMTGWLNHEYPNTCHNYTATVNAIRQQTNQPIFSFEVGQYEVLPDFDQIRDYQGVTVPHNLRHIREKVYQKGLDADWRRMVEAAGESSLLCYRAEVESALRTEGYSGISLLGLQDFPGQGTALVGMMDAHLKPKPYPFAAPRRFAAFFRDVLPLALLPRYTYTDGETLTAQIQIANYGKACLEGLCAWDVSGEGFRREGQLPRAKTPAGALTPLGHISLPLQDLQKAARLALTLCFGGAQNTYPLWVYPDLPAVCPAEVYECRTFDNQARQALRDGGTVYLAPDSTPQALPRSIQAQFSPDFWSVCTFPHQAGGMGQLIDEKHPLFQNFPTEAYSSWQWWPMANQRAMLLPQRIPAIIAEMDSYAFLRPMAKLFECRCGKGRLLVSSLGLHNLTRYPEARALQRAIYLYLASDTFRPGQELSEAWIASLFSA